MQILYYIIFLILLILSAFFSSAETAVLSLNKIKLNLNAKKNNPKAIMLKNILKKPEEFLATILIGNNFVNIGAASISTVLFNHILPFKEELSLLISTFTTTMVVLLFSEILPKSFAFQHSEKLSYAYIYPIRFVRFLFYPLARLTSSLSHFLFRGRSGADVKKSLSTEEIKHFLASELYSYSPETLRMLNEIIDIAEKDIKSIMTPRMNVMAVEESEGMNGLMKMIREKRISKIPICRDNLDNITGVVYTDQLLPTILERDIKTLNLREISAKPLFISEYSTLHYTLREMKMQKQRMAVIVDEYSSTLGVMTLNDIFREILGDIEIGHSPVWKMGENRYAVSGGLTVEEINYKLNLNLPARKEYTTMAGFFNYHFGGMPREGSSVRLEKIHLKVARMQRRRIDKLLLDLNPKPEKK